MQRCDVECLLPSQTHTQGHFQNRGPNLCVKFSASAYPSLRHVLILRATPTPTSPFPTLPPPAAILMARQVVRTCDASLLCNDNQGLEALRIELTKVTDEAFKADIAEILSGLPGDAQQTNAQQSSMHRPPQHQQQPLQVQLAAQAQMFEVVARPGVPFEVLSAQHSGPEHTGAIFTLTYDSDTDSMITTGRDGNVVC